MDGHRCVRMLLAVALTSSCATQFTAQSVRREIVRQTGEDPQRAVVLTVGPVAMSVARQVVGAAARREGTLPLAGLTGFELAVYGVPQAALSGARPLDFSALPARGWEPSLRIRDGLRSGLVLVRAAREHIADLVMLVGGERDVVFARLRGTLPQELPAAIGEAVRGGDTETLRRQLQGLAEGKE